MKLGAASAAVLAVFGGSFAWLEPGLRDHQLSAGARRVFAAVGRGVLEGVLPGGHEQGRELDAFLARVNTLIAGLPPHSQAELSQLLAILQSSAGRRTLAGLDADWEDASTRQVQEALQTMRFSSLALRRQAYQALHEITGSAYFADPATWRNLGYPGPLAI